MKSSKEEKRTTKHAAFHHKTQTKWIKTWGFTFTESTNKLSFTLCYTGGKQPVDAKTCCGLFPVKARLLTTTHHSTIIQTRTHPSFLLCMQQSTNDRRNAQHRIPPFSEYLRMPESRIPQFSQRHYLWVGDGRELLLFKLLNCVFIITKVKFGSHQDYWCVGAMVAHFWVPFSPNILKWCRIH